METLGWICISTAAALMVMLGLYGLSPLAAAIKQTSSSGRLRIKIDHRMAPANPSPAIGRVDQATPTGDPTAVTLDSRSIDELFSEIFALREAVAEMSAQVSALRSSLVTEQSAPRPRLNARRPSMKQPA